MNQNIKILPIRLDDSTPPPTLQDTKYIDFPGESKTAFAEVLRKAIEDM